MTTTEANVEPAWKAWHDEDTPLRVGASSCLLGEEVRYDGHHARDRYVSDVLGSWWSWVRVCPEMELGMGTPRPTIRLHEDDRGVRLVRPEDGADFTDAMTAFATERTEELRAQGLDGYVVKKNSPSCGMERIRIYGDKGMRRKNGRGLYTQVLLERWPNLPVEEDGRLNDPVLRENFIERVFCANRWRAFVRRGLDRRRLVAFHTAHKLLLRAHNESAYKDLGRLVGSAGTMPDEELFAAYAERFHAALRTKATPKKHANVLQHAMGYLKNVLPAAEKREVLTAIEDHRRGLLPLVVPLTLLRFLVRRHGVSYLSQQIYFEPHPKELMLRNHV